MPNEGRKHGKSDINKTRKQIAKKYKRSYNERIKRNKNMGESCISLNDESQREMGCSRMPLDVYDDVWHGAVSDNVDSSTTAMADDTSQPSEPVVVAVGAGTSIDNNSGMDEPAEEKKSTVQRKKEDIVFEVDEKMVKKKTRAVKKKEQKKVIPSWLSSGNSLIQNPQFIPYNSNVVYEYWDDPNELCDRLKFLIASQNAGNTNHVQEIDSIIEELNERGIIV